IEVDKRGGSVAERNVSGGCSGADDRGNVPVGRIAGERYSQVPIWASREAQVIEASPIGKRAGGGAESLGPPVPCQGHLYTRSLQWIAARVSNEALQQSVARLEWDHQRQLASRCGYLRDGCRSEPGPNRENI